MYFDYRCKSCKTNIQLANSIERKIPIEFKIIRQINSNTEYNGYGWIRLVLETPIGIWYGEYSYTKFSDGDHNKRANRNYIDC